MLDLKLLREQTEMVRGALARRDAAHLLEDVLAADVRRREMQTKLEATRHEHSEFSKRVRAASPEERETLIQEARRVSAEADVLEEQHKGAEEQLQMLMARLPNLPHDSVPDGESDDDNEELRTWGRPREIPSARDHLDLGQHLGVVDTERAALASGSRFGYLLGQAVWLEFALTRLAFDRLVARGFELVIPPVLVRRETMFGAGDLPSDEQQYYTTQDGQYLTGTSEQALACLHAEQVLEADVLPLRYAAFSSCFRREAGSYGRDTRGIFRVHQFDKVEMFSFTHPDASWDEHEFLLACEEDLLQALGLPYRVMNVCTAELGAKAAKKYDIEAWFPGQDRYRELTSCSNCTDYQSRRLKIQVRDNGKRRFAHTLNATGVAIGRTLAAILENFQEPSGEVAIPDALHPYLPPGMTRITGGAGRP